MKNYIKVLFILVTLFSTNAYCNFAKILRGGVSLGLSAATGYFAWDVFKSTEKKVKNKFTAQVLEKLCKVYQRILEKKYEFISSEKNIDKKDIAYGLAVTSAGASLVLGVHGIYQVSKGISNEEEKVNANNETVQPKNNIALDTLRVLTGLASLFAAYKSGEEAYPHIRNLINFNNWLNKEADSLKRQTKAMFDKDKAINDLKEKEIDTILKGIGFSLGSLVFGTLGLKLILKGTHITK